MVEFIEVMLPGLVSQPVQVLEAVLALALAGILRRHPQWLTPVAPLWRRATRRPAAFITALALGLIAAHVALEWGASRRVPAAHDEFGYLLTAETFLQGRVTNPTPPEWRALDTVHVNFVPTYNSMYPPGQPVVLAAAWRWLGHPVYANWVLAPFVGWSTWWMLGGWLPGRWALFGGVLVALRLGLFGYWAESYMTGALPAICAQLFAGALPRAVRETSVGIAALGGLGLGVMFSCRPFEAVVLGACAIPMVWLLRPAAGARVAVVRLLPAAAACALVVAAVACHNAALTGDALRFGYDVNMERHGYGVFPGRRTVGSEPATTAHLAAFYDETRGYATDGWTPGGFVGTRLRTLGWAWVFLLGPILSLGWRHWRASLRVQRLRSALPGLLGFWIVVLSNPWSFAHYYSGAFGFLILFAVTGVRLWCVRHRVSASLAAGTATSAAVLVLVVRAAGGSAIAPPPVIPIDWLPYNTPSGLEARARLEQDVATAGPVLVFVRYGPNESVRRDWVYNHPDPPNSRVVWANDLGPDHNSRTARAYAGRRLVCVEIEAGRPRRTDCAPWVAAGKPD